MTVSLRWRVGGEPTYREVTERLARWTNQELLEMRVVCLALRRIAVKADGSEPLAGAVVPLRGLPGVRGQQLTLESTT